MTVGPNPHAPIRWIVYDAAGVILRTGRCSACVVGEQPVEAGETLVRLPTGMAPDPARHCVDVSDPARPRVVLREAGQ